MAAQDTGQDPEAKSNSDVLDSACAHLKRLPQRALGFNYEIVLYIWGRTERFGHRFKADRWNRMYVRIKRTVVLDSVR